MYKVKVNGKLMELAAGQRLLPALRAAGVTLPSVCWHPDVPTSGGRCRVCVCRVDGRIVTPCNVLVDRDGMQIDTTSEDLEHDRRAAMALLTSEQAAPPQQQQPVEEVNGGGDALKDNSADSIAHPSTGKKMRLYDPRRGAQHRPPSSTYSSSSSSFMGLPINFTAAAAEAEAEATQTAEGNGQNQQEQDVGAAAGLVGGANDADQPVLPCGLPRAMRDSYIVSDPSKCVHCGLCVQMCSHIQGLGAIADMRKHQFHPVPYAPRFAGKEGTTDGAGNETTTTNDGCVESAAACGKSANGGSDGAVGTFSHADLFLSECVSCGQCITVCPTGALSEFNEVDVVEKLLKDEHKIKVVQFAPAVRVALAESFGCAPGTRILTKEMVTAIRKVASKTPNTTVVYDTNFTADLTIVEEAAELLERLRRTLTKTRKYGPDNDHMSTALPMITSCSPGWVLFAEKNYHDLLEHLSTCKSPQQMHGAMTKHYWAHKNGHDPKDVIAISVMPCVAKKAEKDRPEFTTGDGIKDVDYSITTREFATMLKRNGVNPLECEEGEFDPAFGFGTGAGMIFGATGGVMEAALRTAYHIVTGRDVPYRGLAITAVRGMEGVRTRRIPLRDVLPEWSFLEGVDLKVAVAHGIANARKLMDRVRETKLRGEAPEFHFIEVMCCPGGCLGGGGQPIPTNMDIKKKRGALIYQESESLPLHKSHDNPRIIEAYRDFLGEVGGHTAHRLLHTHYTPRESPAAALLHSPEVERIRQEVLIPYYMAQQKQQGLKEGQAPPVPRYYHMGRARLTNLFSVVVDHYGYVSDAAVAAIADFVRVSPVEIDAILSHYHFFPRVPTPDSALYLCECPRCRLLDSGASRLKHYLKEQKIPYHTVSWLGWCVNGSPAALVKHKGDPQVHALLNIQVPGPNTDNKNVGDALAADPRLHALGEVRNPFPAITYNIRTIDDYMTFAQNNILKSTSSASTHDSEEVQQTLPLPSVLRHTTVADAEAFVVRAVLSVAFDETMPPERRIEELKVAGLRGCGGAGFPSHIKWTAVRKEPSILPPPPTPPADTPQPNAVSPPPSSAERAVDKVIVINADEGLPSTFKDYHLLQDEGARLRLCAGVAIAAATVGANRVVAYLRYEYKNLAPLLEQSWDRLMALLTNAAPSEAGAAQAEAALAPLSRVVFEVVLGGGPYVCGEETALFESVEGHLPQARVERTIYPTHHGLFGRPTLVSNVETMSWVTQIFGACRRSSSGDGVIGGGGSAFASLGASSFGGSDASAAASSFGDQRGAKVLSIGGDVDRPLLAEVPLGTTLAEVLAFASSSIDSATGGTINSSAGRGEACNDIEGSPFNARRSLLFVDDDHHHHSSTGRHNNPDSPNYDPRKDPMQRQHQHQQDRRGGGIHTLSPRREIVAVEVGGILESLTYPSDFPTKILSLDNKPGHLSAGGSVVVYRASINTNNSATNLKENTNTSNTSDNDVAARLNKNDIVFNERAIFEAKAKFANIESCQLCNTCRHGTSVVRSCIRSAFDGNLLAPNNAAQREQLLDIAAAMEQASNCGHGKAAGKMTRELIEHLSEKEMCDTHTGGSFC